MTPQHVEAIMADIAEGDPLDFADLSIHEEDARAMMASHFCEMDRELAASGLSSDERLEIMVAVAAHAMVENMLLNIAQLRRARAEGADFSAWMRRHGLSGSA
jgi:hypothetical protein